MTECTDNKQEPCPHIAKLQEKSLEMELESTKAIVEEAFKKIETLAQENADLRKKLKTIAKVYEKYDYLDGYMEKYGANTDLELDMWRAIRQVLKE